jgi:hypothetical protein
MQAPVRWDAAKTLAQDGKVMKGHEQLANAPHEETTKGTSSYM